MLISRLPSAGASGKTGVAVGAIAMVCCAALPAVVGGLSLAALLGAGAGIVVIVGALSLAGLPLLNARRRRKCHVVDEARQP
jgi:hypothetical protein